MFGTFADLAAALERRLSAEEFDAVIHAAAVSDFSLQAIEVNGTALPAGVTKLDSGAAPTLRLRRNPKLLDTLRHHSRNRALRVVAFKLTQEAEAPAARAAVIGLFANGAADFVVHNDLAARTANGAFPATIWRADGTIARECTDRLALAVALEKLLADQPNSVEPLMSTEKH
jgi:phosphopantothenoylcysteine decarboxylase/phosphopantothenate--cysteine ligase